jgi:hypothetical protein
VSDLLFVGCIHKSACILLPVFLLQVQDVISGLQVQLRDLLT